MLRPVYSKRFDRDIRRLIRRGKDTEKLKEVIRKLIREEKLDKRYKNHALKGDYKDCCDCHIEPDRILIYRIEKESVQTGSHSDLFG